jgi:hypothetical protein
MIQRQQSMILSPFMDIYNLVIPKDNLLRQINELIDFSFVYDELKDNYCLDNGRNAPVIEPSSLTKFRKLRLRNLNLLDMLITKTVEIAIEKEIIKSKAIIVDATHTKARYNQKSPNEILMDRSRKLRKAVYKIDESMKTKFPAKTTTDILEDEIDYC